MKNFTKSVAMVCFLIATATFFSACNEEQTSFSLDDIENSAKIVGYLSYSEGQTYEEGNFTEKVKPAAGKKVYVEINNSELSPKGNARGYSIFETTTDSQGNYEIEVPTVATAQGINVIVRAENFTGNQSFVKDVEDGYPVFDTKSVIFTSPTQVYSLKPNELIAADIKYIAKERDIEEGLTEVANIKVKIGMGALKENPSSWRPLPYYTFKQGIGALLTTYYEEYRDGYYTTIERKYSGVTNEAGEFTLPIPVSEKRGYLKITMEVSPTRENNFIYPYDYTTYIFTGVYRQYHERSFIQSYDYGLVYYDENNPTTIEARMVFEADNGQDAHYYYSPSDYNWEGTPLEN